MANSNAIRTALKIMNRVLELRYAGLKLKESKSDLRVILIELRNELPAEILFNVEQVLRRRSGRDFFNQLSTVIYCAEAALRVAEQMDGYHAEALEINALIDRAKIAEDSADAAAAWRDHINSPEVAQERFAEYSPKMKKHFVDRSHDEALRMNEGIALALRLITCMKGDYKVGGAVAGCLIRDGFHEVDYLVQVAARKYAQQGTAEITAHVI